MHKLIWNEAVNRRCRWIYDAARNSPSPSIIFKEGFNQEIFRPKVILFGPARAGKTSLLLFLLGLRDPKKKEELDKILCIGSEPGLASASCATMYFIGSENEWLVGIRGEADFVSATDTTEIEQKLRSVRSRISQSELKPDNILEIGIPHSYFEENKLQAHLEIIELPGFESSDSTGHGYMKDLLVQELQTASLCLLVTKWNELNKPFEKIYSLFKDDVRTLDDLTKKVRLICTWIFSEDSKTHAFQKYLSTDGSDSFAEIDNYFKARYQDEFSRFGDSRFWRQYVSCCENLWNGTVLYPFELEIDSNELNLSKNQEKMLIGWREAIIHHINEDCRRIATPFGLYRQSKEKIIADKMYYVDEIGKEAKNKDEVIAAYNEWAIRKDKIAEYYAVKITNFENEYADIKSKLENAKDKISNDCLNKLGGLIWNAEKAGGYSNKRDFTNKLISLVATYYEEMEDILRATINYINDLKSDLNEETPLNITIPEMGWEHYCGGNKADWRWFNRLSEVDLNEMKVFFETYQKEARDNIDLIQHQLAKEISQYASDFESLGKTMMQKRDVDLEILELKLSEEIEAKKVIEQKIAGLETAQEISQNKVVKFKAAVETAYRNFQNQIEDEKKGSSSAGEYFMKLVEQAINEKDYQSIIKAMGDSDAK